MARANNATRGTTDSVIIGEGASRLVSKGTYTEGDRKGQSCVSKWFKTEYVSQRYAFFALDIRAVGKAIEIVEKWNAEKYTASTIWVNKAAVWYSTQGIEKESQFWWSPSSKTLRNLIRILDGPEMLRVGPLFCKL